MRPWSTLRALFALAGIVSAPGARAAGPALHCVKTPADLLVALSAASSEDDVEVRVVAGIYPMPASFGLDYQGTGNARVSGGWDNYCVHQTPNTLLTLLQPVAGGQPIGATFEAMKGDLEIDTLTFQDMKYGVLVRLGEQDGWSPYHRARVTNSAFLRDGSVRVERADGPDCDRFMDIQFLNNLVADSQDGVLATEITGCWHDAVGVVHSTFANSVGAALGLYGSGWPAVVNSAFSHDAATVVWSPGGQLFYFCGNVGDNLTGYGWAECAPGQNLDADPQLGFTFLPLPGSPVVDFGRTPQQMAQYDVAYPDFDLTGGSRFVGPRPDAGAYEVQQACTP